MTGSPSVSGTSAAAPSFEMPLPSQVVDSLKFSSDAVTAYINSAVSSLPQDRPLTEDQAADIYGGLSQFPESEIKVTGPDGRGYTIEELRQRSGFTQEGVVVPETGMGEVSQTPLAQENSTAIERTAVPEGPELPAPAPEAATPSVSYSEKAFRKDTPEKIKQKASSGSLSADEAKMWATTTTKEGRALLGISGRMDASDRAKLSRRNLDRKRAERGESPEAGEKSGGSFIGKAVANAVTWPVRGIMKLFGAKDAAERLRLASPAEVSQPGTTRGVAVSEPDNAVQDYIEEEPATPEIQPRVETSPLPPAEDAQEDPVELLESL
jgi:hypothetical protein